ncbi:MAG: nucleoid-structuring protein H-NS, partial [Candidatus Omnitrophica bacterium]|nr:nucleoid-structuring protein H-NS [Candidatus Omnitrophota bacterium]
MFREQIKVLDCTIRDGGLINNHDFDRRFVREVYKAISGSGIDYIE